MTDKALHHAELTITASTAEASLIAAGGAGVFHDVHAITISNISNTDTVVEIRSATGGAVRYRWMLAAKASFGFNRPWDTAAKQDVANEAWTVKGLTSITSLEVTAEYHKRTTA